MRRGAFQPFDEAIKNVHSIMITNALFFTCFEIM